MATNIFIGGQGYGIGIIENPNDGLWHQAVATFDRDGLHFLYFDGATQLGGIDISSKDGIPMDDVSVLRIATGANGRFIGDVDEVSVYKKVLTPAQVKAHYLAGIVGKTAKSRTAELTAVT